MAKIQYDRLSVLNEATNLFWKSGYYATSMQDLFEVTGLKAGSVYLAFGNKENLFKMTIEYYTNTSLASLKQLFDEQGSAKKSICYLFEKLIKDSYNDDFSSCFLVKSQLELDNNEELKNYVSDQLRRLEQFHFEQLLTLYKEDEAKEKAVAVMLHLFGIYVYGYNCKNQETLKATLHQSLPWLPWCT